MKALALDLGGSGGKIFLGSLDGRKLNMQEVHRFANRPIEAARHFYWDIMGIYLNLLEGILKAGDCDSVGVDAFCNDYGLLDATGALYSQIYMYRDSRTEGIPEKIDEFIPPLELYRRTGCQRARFNTLVQLSAQIGGQDAFLLNNASRLLFVPELLDYFLSGEIVAEYTISSVSQAMNRESGDWDDTILKLLGIPQKIFPKIVPSATKIGKAQKSILAQTGTKEFTVCSVCHHDTASAVMAVPSLKTHFAYISSGTWSLMGTETTELITTPSAFKYNFANEGGFNGTNRFLKNIMGLWLLQECQREFDTAGLNLTYEALDAMAEKCKPFRSVINPNSQEYFHPGNMVQKIQQQCSQIGQPVPETPGEINRCIKESLAFAYRDTLEHIILETGFDIPFVHIIGGGAKSILLNQYAASAMARPVYAGPVEAAAIGNLCAQFIAAGELTGLTDAREIINNSFEIHEYLPQNIAQWEDAYCRYKEMF
ncbi:MAG: rhamnulokinase family protein [Eubacteriales bacterium]